MQSHSDWNPSVPLERAGRPTIFLHPRLHRFACQPRIFQSFYRLQTPPRSSLRPVDAATPNKNGRLHRETYPRIHSPPSKAIQQAARRCSHVAVFAETSAGSERNFLSSTEDEPARPAAAQVRAIPDGAARPSTENRAAVSLPHAAVSF